MLAIVAAIRSRNALLAVSPLLLLACVPDYELHHRDDSGAKDVRQDGGTGGRAPADVSDRASSGSSGRTADASDVPIRFDALDAEGSAGLDALDADGASAGFDVSKDSIADSMSPDGATHRLFASDNGIAFVSTPGLTKLSQAVTVVDSKGQATDWQATSNQPWLHCTPFEGRAGDTMVVTADPANLPLDTVHYATVSVWSRDPTVANDEKIRIGLWAGGSTPLSSVSVPLPFVEVAVDPIRPFAYAHNGGTTLSVYNVYTGFLAGVYSQPGAKLANMSVSSDGSKLFVVDAANHTVLPIRLGVSPPFYEVGVPWPLDAAAPSVAEYGRTRGVGAVYGGDGRIRDAETGAVFASSFRARDIIGLSKNGKRLCTLDAVSSPYNLDCYPVDVDDGDNVIVGTSQTAESFQGFGQDVALTADGTRVWVATTGTDTFRAYNWVDRPELHATLLGAFVPNNVEMIEDGRILAGANASAGPKDVWLYDSLGIERASFRVGRPSTRQLRVSGDGRRIAVITGEATSAPALQFLTLATPGSGPADSGAGPGAGDSGLPDVAVDVPGEAGGGSGCGSTPPVAAVGAYQKASCGSLDVTDVLPGDQGIVYLVSIPLRRVVAWSAVSGACSNPIPLKISPKYVTYSSVNHRLYVAYTGGEVTSIDPDSQAEETFVATAGEPNGIGAAQGWVLVSKNTGIVQVLDAGGREADRRDIHNVGEFTWTRANSNMYFLAYGSVPLYSWSFDCVTGQIGNLLQSSYMGSYVAGRALRVSPDGQTVLIGGSELYDGTTFQRRTALPRIAKDATWLWNGKLLRLRASSTGSVVEQRGGADLHVENLQAFEGTPVTLRSIGDGAVVVTTIASQPVFSTYHDNLDGDGDGVPYAQDALPLEKAASVDSDHDGFPDVWNAGQDGGAPPLALDAFPEDSACHLASEARTDDATRCDIGGTIPEYTPTSIAFDGTDVVYSFSPANRRVFRYSIAQGKDLNPFVLKEDASVLAYGDVHGKLYLGREDGSLATIDPVQGIEVDFGALPRASRGLAEIGNFLFGATSNNAAGMQYVFGQDGSLLFERSVSSYSRDYAFNSTTSRLYFSRDEVSPNDLLSALIDPSSGALTDVLSPNPSGLTVLPPIRVSLDGGYILLGTGEIYDGISIGRLRTLGFELIDAAWLPDNSLAILTADGNLRRFDDTFTPGAIRAVTGTPLRVFWTAGKLVVVAMVNGKPSIEVVAL